MPFDPTTLGARCDVCPLGPKGALRKDEWKPVGCEVHKGATVLAVAESPDPEEVQHGRPLVGRSGGEWNRALAACGHRRLDIDLDHVIACHLPGQASGALRRLSKAVDKLNRKRVREGQEAVPHPLTCCRPRLLYTAARYPSIITLGKLATNSLTGVGSSIQATRGGPMRITHDWSVTTESAETAHRVLPTLHPSFILRSPSWRRVLHADIGKAFRWFNDTLEWTQPDSLWRPTPDQLESLRSTLKQ